MADNGIEEISSTIEMEVEAEPSAEIEMEMEVHMGGASSEYNAEAWAVGERGGVPVSETDQTYHNNAKYYATETSASAEEVAKVTAMTVSASGLAAGAAPTAQISEVSGHKHITFGIPKGEGIASIVLNSDYTLTITYTDGTSITTDSIHGTEAGIYAIDATIPVSAWTGSGPYTAVVTDSAIKASMKVIEWDITNETLANPLMLGETEPTVTAGTITITTTVKPTASWSVHFDLGVDRSFDLPGISRVESSVAIVSDGNTHPAIPAGSYVIINNHDTLADGMYVSGSAAIAADETLSTDNVTACPSGGLNSVRLKYVDVRITNNGGAFGDGGRYIASYKPSLPNFLFAILLTVEGTYANQQNVFYVSADGNRFYGIKESRIPNIIVRYFYTD